MLESNGFDLKPLLKNTQSYNAVQKFLDSRYLELIKNVQSSNMQSDKIEYIERMAEVDYLKKELDRKRIKLMSGR